MLKIFKNLSGPLGAGGGATLLGIASLLSYGAGLGRDLALNYQFGFSAETDAYLASFLLPDFIFNFLVLGFISGGFLPIFTQLKKSSKFFHSFLTLIVLSTIIMSVVAWLFTPQLINFIFTEATVDTALIIKNTRIMLLSPLIFGISNVLGMVLLSHKHYLSMALSPLLYNCGIIAGILFFGGQFGVMAAVWGTVLGAVLHLLIRLYDLFACAETLRWRLTWNKDLQKVFLLGLPRAVGLVALQITLIVFTKIAGQLQDGAITAWNFARNIQSLPVSLFGIAIATAVLPWLADLAAQAEDKKWQRRIAKSGSQILFFTLPAAVGLALLAKPVAEFLFGWGEQGDTGVTLLTSILLALALAIPAEALTHLLARASVSRQNTLLPMVGKIIFGITACGVAWQGSAAWGVAALGIGFASGLVLEMLWLFFAISWFTVHLPQRRLFLAALRLIGLTILMTIIVWLVQQQLINQHLLLRLFIPAAVGGVSYLLAAWMLKEPVLRNALWWRK